MAKKADAFRTMGDIAAADTARPRVSMDSAVQGLRRHRAGVSPAHPPGVPVPPGSPAFASSGELNHREFALRYFPHHFTSAFCEMHDDIFAACDDEASGKRVARIAPRKMGKTTIISLVLPARALAYQKKFFVLLIGESADTAEANLGTLSQELETNELLLRDFPHLRPAVDARGQTVKWTDRQIVLANYATVRAKGMGARMRGMKHRQRRPDLAILDDPESPETADTFLKRIRHKRWFGGTFMGLGADTWDIFVIGNLPHHDCLIAGLVCDSGWDGRLWRAENIPPREKERYPIGNTKTDGSALWPEVWSITALRKYAAEPEVGALGYAREMMNDPREEENKAFSPGEFCYFDYDHDMLKTYRELAISLDPAGGENPGEVKRGKRDYAVAAVMGRTADGHIDVIDVWMKKVLPDAQIDAVLDLYTVYGGYISVEENMYKNLLKTSMERAGRDRGLYPVVKVRTSAQNKVTRILSLQPPIRQRIMRFANHLTEKYPEFFAQFDEFPGTYDDAPDSVEGGLRALEKRNFSGTRIISLTGSSHWKEKA